LEITVRNCSVLGIMFTLNPYQADAWDFDRVKTRLIGYWHEGHC
jgi:NADPH-dependent ferric siderophore reductase